MTSAITMCYKSKEEHSKSSLALSCNVENKMFVLVMIVHYSAERNMLLYLTYSTNKLKEITRILQM
jgi:hypothetical protein